MNPKISIIVPIYNVEKYIHKCIDSILDQSFNDFELILVDDESPDKCGEICDYYKKKDERVIVIHKKNGGPSDARNVGIDRAKGEYIAFIDGDDFIERDMYETMYKTIEENKADICICSLVEVDENGEKLNEYIINKVSLSEMILRSYPCNKLFNKKLFINNRFAYGKYYEDLELIPKLYLQSRKVVSTNKIGYNYVKRAGAITSKVDDKILDWLDAYMKLKKYMIEEDIFYKYEKEFTENTKIFKKTYLYHLYHYNIFSLLKQRKYIFKNMKYLGAINNKQYVSFFIKRIFIATIRAGSYIKNKLV